MRLPRDISPAAARRRSLLADLGIALVIALISLQLATGVGVVGFFALMALLALLAWIGIEATIRRAARRRAPPGRSGRTRPSTPSLR